MSTQPGPPPPKKSSLLILGIAIGAVVALMLVIFFLGLAWLGFSYFHGQTAPPQVVPLSAPPARPPVARVRPAERFERVERVEREARVEPPGLLEPAPSSIAPVFHLRSPTQNLLDGKPFVLETPFAEVRNANGYLVVSDAGELRIPGPITISVWFNARSVGRAMTLCSRALNGPPWQFPFSSWLVRMNDPVHFEGTLTSSSGGYAPSTWTVPRFSPGQWYHAVVTYDGRIKKLFLNGEQQKRLFSGKLDHTSPTRYTPGRSVLIGADESESPAAEIFDGAIDDLHIFNRALPELEILEIYAKSPHSAEGGGNRLRE